MPPYQLRTIGGVGKIEQYSLIRSLLSADKVVWTKSISQRYFMNEFTNYLSAEPFTIMPHLTRLWAALDVERKGFIDFREFACLLRCACTL